MNAQLTSVWFTGICDQVLMKVLSWWMNYESGEVCKDQDFLTREGNVVKMPTMHAMRIPWSRPELEHLARIVSEQLPKTELASEVRLLSTRWKSGKLLPMAGNYRVMTLLFYKEHVKQILDALQASKQGQLVLKVNELIEERSKAGKDLFEV